MQTGEAWDRLRRLLEIGEERGALPWSLDARAVKNGNVSTIRELGITVLTHLVEVALREQLRGKGYTSHVCYTEAGHGAWWMTRDEGLAELFDAIGLDSHLSNHPDMLGLREKADVIRSLTGELERALERTGRGGTWRRWLRPQVPWQHELQMRLARALLELQCKDWACVDQEPPDPDAKLVWLLRSGSARSIAERIRELHSARDEHIRRQLWCTLAATLPTLRAMRLLVFVQILHSVVTPPEVEVPKEEEEEQASLAAKVVDAVLAAHLPNLPYETPEQFRCMKQSPYLSEKAREQLIALLAPVNLPPPQSGAAVQEQQRHSSLLKEELRALAAQRPCTPPARQPELSPRKEAPWAWRPPSPGGRGQWATASAESRPQAWKSSLAQVRTNSLAGSAKLPQQSENGQDEPSRLSTAAAKFRHMLARAEAHNRVSAC